LVSAWLIKSLSLFGFLEGERNR